MNSNLSPFCTISVHDYENIYENTFGKFEYIFSGLNGYFLVNIDHFWTYKKEISSKSQLEKIILQYELGQ